MQKQCKQELVGKIIDPTQPNIQVLEPNSLKKNTREFPLGYKFVIADWGPYPIIFFENTGKVVRVYINGGDQFKEEEIELISPYTRSILFTELLLSYPEKLNPILHLVNNQVGKKFTFIYSIELCHIAVYKLFNKAFLPNMLIRGLINFLFDFELPTLRRKLNLPCKRKESELICCNKEFIIPTQELNALCVLDREGESVRYNEVKETIKIEKELK